MNKELIGVFKGMPKALEGVLNAIQNDCGGNDISKSELIKNAKVSTRNHRGLVQEVLNLGKCTFGCKQDVYEKNLAETINDSEKYKSRKDDANRKSSWIANGISFYSWNELSYDEFSEFISIFNEIYQKKYSVICVNPNDKNKEYSFYKVEQATQIAQSDTFKHQSNSSSFSVTLKQQIFFGAPGTGKSFAVNQITNDKNTFRTTFHPDYDYAQFVGSYKPKKDKSDSTKIVYEFVPQIFAKTYVDAWKKYSNNQTPVYLVIEEINRGNCAQIFGDIFQLLDRNANGMSQYAVDADSDFANYIKDELSAIWNEYVKQVGGEDKIKLPPNFNILATMNTSDQSLFPMDSAFKRRFDWEYIPINYEKAEADFVIDIGDAKYRWLEFLKKVNENIFTITSSEDKQMGEFFVKPKDGSTIDLPMFKSKVLFYLWDSVYKDEGENADARKVFHFRYPEKDGSTVTFQCLFGKDDADIIKKMMENLDVKAI